MNFRIRKPRALTTANLVFGTFLGVCSGFYIWNTPLKLYLKEEASKTVNPEVHPDKE